MANKLSRPSPNNLTHTRPLSRPSSPLPAILLKVFLKPKPLLCISRPSFQGGNPLGTYPNCSLTLTIPIPCTFKNSYSTTTGGSRTKWPQVTPAYQTTSGPTCPQHQPFVKAELPHTRGPHFMVYLIPNLFKITTAKGFPPLPLTAFSSTKTRQDSPLNAPFPPLQTKSQPLTAAHLSTTLPES